MEKSSVLLCKGFSPSMVLLIIASFLTFWHLSITAAMTTELVPATASEGDDVLFLVQDLPENIIAFAWYKGLQTATKQIAAHGLRKNITKIGFAYTGREKIYRNGSLLFEKVNVNDEGFYTIRTFDRRGNTVSTSQLYLNVNAFLWKCGDIVVSSQTTVESVPSIVAEGKSVLLLIHNIPENAISFSWYKGKRNPMNLLVIKYIRDMNPTMLGPEYSGRVMVHSDGSLLLHAVTEKDRGLYKLIIERLHMEVIETEVELKVDTSHSPFCNPLTSSQLMIQAVPPYPAEGQTVFLQVHNVPEDLQEFSWYKSKDRTIGHKFAQYRRARNSFSWGPSQRIRGRIFKNASMLLHDFSEEDAGTYTLEVLNKDSNIEKANVKLSVKKSLREPFVHITDTTDTGGSSVIFTCITPDTNTFIRWIFNNRNLHLSERQTLSPTKCGLRIDPVKSEDTGTYQCVVSNGFSSKTSLPVSWP